MRPLRTHFLAVLATTVGALLFASAGSGTVPGPPASGKGDLDQPGVDYPSGYRSWQHVKSMLIQPGHALEDPFGGIHHVYANAKAMSGLESGKYQDGAIFVFDLLDYVDKDLTIVEADRARVDVMEYGSERFSETGGWGFTTFVGDSQTERVDQDVAVACFDCHKSAEASGHVFSRYRP